MIFCRLGRPQRGGHEKVFDLFIERNAPKTPADTKNEYGMLEQKLWSARYSSPISSTNNPRPPVQRSCKTHTLFQVDDQIRHARGSSQGRHAEVAHGSRRITAGHLIRIINDGVRLQVGRPRAAPSLLSKGAGSPCARGSEGEVMQLPTVHLNGTRRERQLFRLEPSPWSAAPGYRSMPLSEGIPERPRFYHRTRRAPEKPSPHHGRGWSSSWSSMPEMQTLVESSADFPRGVI